MTDRAQIASTTATTPTTHSATSARTSLPPLAARAPSSANTSPSLTGSPSRPSRFLRRRASSTGTACPDVHDQFLEIDHVVPIAAGGRTEIGNAWRVCPHHHALKTYFGWRVVGEPGNWDLRPPDDPDPP